MARMRLALCFVAIQLLCAMLVRAQESQVPPSSAADDKQVLSDEEIRLLRGSLRSQRKQIIAQNLSLTDSEAQRFWPVYDRYTSDLIKINDTKYKLIQAYVEKKDLMTEAQANTWIEQWLQVDAETVSLRQKYVPDFRKVLPTKKVVTFEQLDRRIQLMIDLQLASQVPLLEPGH